VFSKKVAKIYFYETCGLRKCDLVGCNVSI